MAGIPLASIKFWSLIFTVIYPFQSLSAQVYFNNFQVEHGLSNNAILCSVQDKDGFMWFGTRDGLNRFDGYNFKSYYYDPEDENGLGSNFIHSLFIGQSNEIWIGTDQGVYTFDPKTENFHSIPETHNREVIQIEQDAVGNIWFIGDNALYRYLPQTKELQKQSTISNREVVRFCIDHEDNVWYGAGQRIIRLNEDISYSFETLTSPQNRIQKLYVDKDNNIWIGTSKNGLLKWSVKTREISLILDHLLPHTPFFVRDVLQVDEEHLWIASEIGLLIYNTQTQQYKLLRHEKDNPWSLSDNALYTITRDHQNGIWVGTFFGGINYYHPQHNFFEKIFPRYSANSIQGHATREIVEDRFHNLWIGTEDQGLTWWDPRINRFETLDPTSNLSHTNIHGLAIVGDSLLAGTFYRGMNIIDTRTRKVVKQFNTENTNGNLGSDFVFCIYKTRNGQVYLGTLRGLYRFTPGIDHFSRVENVPRHIFYTSIYEDNEGNIWLSTWRDGLLRFSPETGELLHFKHKKEDKSSINSNRVNRIFQDSKANIWIGTGSGIARWDPHTHKFDKITKKDGLPSNLILGFEEDDEQNLWISTSHGLVKMNIPTHAFEIFDTELGLLDLQFNYNSVFKDSQGYLYFGSSRGLIRFNPAMMTDSYKTGFLTPIYITGIQINQHEISIGADKDRLHQSIMYTDKIVLNHDESTISIDFAALNFVSAKSTSYLYRLVGLGSSWTFLRTNGKAYFTKIPPGTYTFQVMACDANGKPISKEKSLEIVIKPPIWASIPAFSLYGILTLGLITALLYAYDKKIKDKNRRRLEQIKNHKEKELYKAKMDFFMQVTHEFKTPLTLIKAPLEKILTNHKGQKTRNWLDIIQQNTDKLIELTDQLLDFRKVETEAVSLQLRRQQVNRLIKICIDEFEPLIEKKGLALHVDMKEDVEAHIDIEIIYKIVNNLLSNAIKYANSNVEVRLSTDHTKRTFLFEVKNDGVVLSPHDIVHIFKPFHRSSSHYQVEGSGLGLALAHSFAIRHRGELRFMENSKNLNIFVLEIPL